ncbi:MAG: hypothetical protein AAF310_02650 [Myxococcota bacterium]
MRQAALFKVVQFVRLPWDWGQLGVFYQLDPLHIRLERLKKLERRKRLRQLLKKNRKPIHA